jgi:glycosyltransferase involved in cell wall biosynthesis
MGPRLVAVLPGDVDDPARTSGGNTYDRRLVTELRRRGWRVSWQPVAGGWPDGDTVALTALADVLHTSPPEATLLLDGLLASGAPDVVVPAAGHRRVVVLVHQPLGVGDPAAYAREGPALRAADAVVATSRWSADWLVAAYGLAPGRVHVASPGADPAPVAAGSPAGNHLLCVASVVPGKGHDVLVDALSDAADLDWTCDVAGSLARAPGFVADVGRWIARAGLSARVELRGPMTGDVLAAAYDAADLLVLPTRAETWGMVVTEALARGIPVVASEVGGVPEALGTAPGGGRPGMLVPAGDPAALAAALRRWLTDPGLREHVRDVALLRRAELPGWDVTADAVTAVLQGVAA